MDPNQLKIVTLEENPERHEQVIRAQQLEADPDIRKLLESTYLEADRLQAFERFRAGYEFRTILALFDIFGVGRVDKLCEIGGGSGFFSCALSRSGFADIHLMEPNGHFNTGTGYLRSRADSTAIRIHNDLKAWHAGPDRYDVIVTKNCVHHFSNISQAAASIRQKMKLGARWFAFREWFADSPGELYLQIASHPYCQPYGLYEWPYPASHYAEAIEIAGFALTAVVPSGYANNTLGTYQEDCGPLEVQQLTAQIDALLRANPAATVEAFWDEVTKNRTKTTEQRFFTRPQLMVFAVKEI